MKVLYQIFDALKNLESNSKIVVLTADEGKSTVDVNVFDYNSKVNWLLQNVAYTHIVRDTT